MWQTVTYVTYCASILTNVIHMLLRCIGGQNVMHVSKNWNMFPMGPFNLQYCFQNKTASALCKCIQFIGNTTRSEYKVHMTNCNGSLFAVKVNKHVCMNWRIVNNNKATEGISIANITCLYYIKSKNETPELRRNKKICLSQWPDINIFPPDSYFLLNTKMSGAMFYSKCKDSSKNVFEAFM